MPFTRDGDLTAVPPHGQLAALASAIGHDAPDESILLPGGFVPSAPANSNKRPLLIGITGRRNVGKSTMALLLESTFGFTRVHAFDGGKVAAVALFEHMTGSIDIANEMVYGPLKDMPSPYLPGAVAPRYFLEKLGKFMGVEMGVEWTIAMEVARARRMSPASPIVVESLVYEVDWFRANGGYIVRLERPDFEGPAVGSDAFQAAIDADVTITARSVAELEDKALRLVDSLVGRVREAA